MCELCVLKCGYVHTAYIMYQRILCLHVCVWMYVMCILVVSVHSSLEAKPSSILRNRELTEYCQTSAVGFVGLRTTERACRAASILVLIRQRGVRQRSGTHWPRKDPGGTGTLPQGRGSSRRQPTGRTARVWGRQEWRPWIYCSGLAHGGLVLLGRGGLEGRVHFQEGMGKKVGDVSAGGRRGRWSTDERSSCWRRMSSYGRLEGLLGSRGKPSKAEALSDKRRSVQAQGGRWLLGNA